MNPMNAGHGEKMTRKKEQAIAALLSEGSVQAAAVKAAVSHSTLKRWLKEPGFQDAYRQARRQVVDSAVSLLTRIANGAVAALARNLSCGNAGVEVRSAQVVLDHVLALRGDDLEELQSQVTQLQATVAAIQARRGR